MLQRIGNGTTTYLIDAADAATGDTADAAAATVFEGVYRRTWAVVAVKKDAMRAQELSSTSPRQQPYMGQRVDGVDGVDGSYW